METFGACTLRHNCTIPHPIYRQSSHEMHLICMKKTISWLVTPHILNTWHKYADGNIIRKHILEHSAYLSSCFCLSKDYWFRSSWWVSRVLDISIDYWLSRWRSSWWVSRLLDISSRLLSNSCSMVTL